MKLIFCQKCHDIVALRKESRTCSCGQSGGRYIDNLNAEIYGEAIPLGIANPSFREALANQPQQGKGKDFSAFVIPKTCPTVKIGS